MLPLQRLLAFRVGWHWSLWLTGLALTGYASGLLWRPAEAEWAWLHDLVLYNGVYAGAAAACLRTARARVAETTAWRAVACALVLSATGSVWYSLVLAPSTEQSYPSLADALWLAYYPMMYVALIRARVRRFLASMWLDGLIGGLGAAAVALSVLLGPALTITEGSMAAVAFTLAYPMADVLLLAILVGVGAMLGLRQDPTLWLLGVGLTLNLAGDIVYLDLAATGVYVEGGPLDLTWLIGAALLAAAAAPHVRGRPRSSRPLVLGRASAGSCWRSPWATLRELLEIHASAEEAVLYPKLARAADEGAEEAAHAVHDHNEIRDSVRAVQEHAVGSEGWRHALRRAREVNEEHLQEEERDPLPLFRENTDRARREELGQEWLACHEQHHHARGLAGEDVDPRSVVEGRS